MPHKTVKKSTLPVARKQSGFALLTVLLVVALVSVVASELLYQQEINIKRSGFMIHQSHSLSVSYGFEGWVKKGLKADIENNQTDHLNEEWAQPLLPVDFEGGLVSGELLDLQARLNLNNILETDSAKQAFWRNAIQRLLQQRLADNQVVTNIQGFTDVLHDWVDADDEARDLGAESALYLLQKPAYRAANQPLVMVSELQKLQGMQNLTNAEVYALSKWLSTLPTITSVNVNTASKEVLMALTDWFNDSLAEQWLLERKTQPAEEVAEFTNFLITATGFEQVEIENAFPNGVLSVSSDYFLLQARIDYGQVKQAVSTIFQRNESKVTIVQRWLSVA